MIHGLTGKLKRAALNYLVITVAGVDYKVYVALSEDISIKEGEEISLFTYLHVTDGAMSLYGFSSQKELDLFEALISVSGVGPKSALGILSVASPDKISASIAEASPELLQRSSGVGKRTAERIIVELKDKVTSEGSGEIMRLAEADRDVYEALFGLGYKRDKIEDVLKQIDPELEDVRDRLREALRKIRG
ncbi:MAG: Holliday junction branch migration protein RuvA [Candidatus Colwellbacteria bacterium CG10_big_fil_rev_8_21_14_0_10_41_28]|uniref:Holliday junction branch migration complex subunit RuvA n=1 Tax=Candidatus Colwellbacteria bacterium CG10_big_fil_rev_8_21_14_0_10_41_28 TaxID=1974539 RepID=A0A2H0VJ36_9BACT|nr:MAG: Holliday junction branch migration protein RuvA [Candidatus Colwellbacteria bacterium CG10_big_fil_rev_8_21_14_0_10_41_28]